MHFRAAELKHRCGSALKSGSTQAMTRQEQRRSFVNRTASLARCTLLGVSAAFSLTGCVLRPHLVSAQVESGSGSHQVIRVALSKDDAQSIKDREIYFSIVVADCNNLANRFPIEAYISQEPASEFNFPITGDFLIA